MLSARPGRAAGLRRPRVEPRWQFVSGFGGAQPAGELGPGRPDDLHTFQVLPGRRVVERTLSWITRHRRTVRDYERLAAHHETYVYWAMIIVMTRRLARQPAAAQPTAT